MYRSENLESLFSIFFFFKYPCNGLNFILILLICVVAQTLKILSSRKILLKISIIMTLFLDVCPFVNQLWTWGDQGQVWGLSNRQVSNTKDRFSKLQAFIDLFFLLLFHVMSSIIPFSFRRLPLFTAMHDIVTSSLNCDKLALFQLQNFRFYIPSNWICKLSIPFNSIHVPSLSILHSMQVRNYNYST